MDIVLNPESENPIYLQIYSQISSQILNGSLTAGEQLPPIRQISNELRISVIPVKMAWEELNRNGFISTTTGRGTFVNDLQSSQINVLKNQKAENLVLETCKKAKELNISALELIDLINRLY